MTGEHLRAVSIAGLERMAAETLPDDAFAYFSTGARDEITERANRAAWESWCFVPSVLVDTTATTTDTVVLGTAVRSPVMVAPMAAQRLAHPKGELATARAASRAGCIMVLSMSANEPIEAVARVNGLLLWLQLYMTRDQTHSRELIERAHAAGAKAIVLTVDSVLERSAHRRPHGDRAADFPPMPMNPGGEIDDRIDWEFVTRLAHDIELPLVLKGILSPVDAVRAADAGCAAIIVSNHGGRQLDGAVTTAQILPEVASAVGDRMEVYVDGGVRRGGDVLKALALGARAVLVGRPVLWGLAAAGERGVSRVLDLLAEELLADSRQAGVLGMGVVPRELVVRNWVTIALAPADPVRGQ